MKHLRFLTIALTILLSSCVKSQMEQQSKPAYKDGIAFLQLGLSVDSRFQIAQTRAASLDPALVPVPDSLNVELYRFSKASDKAKKETWNRIYFGKYEDAKDSTFRVNGGNWKLVAFHGDSTACGFDKPYYRAEKDFIIDGGQPTVSTVEAEARVENVWITVEFDETVSGSYYDYFVRFTNLLDKRHKQILRFKKGQTRPAFMMPTDSLKIEFMAQYEYGDDSSWRYKVLDTVKVSANDHLTVSLSVTDPRHGTLDVNIKTDDNIIKKNEDVEILEVWAPQDAPQIVAAGFPNDEHSVVEGDNKGNNATISVLARGGLKNFFFRIDSEYLTAENDFDLPLGVELDLANPTPQTQAMLDKLAAGGFDWQDNMLGTRRLTYLTMTKLFEKINGQNTSLDHPRTLATFSIRVVDDVNKVTEKVLTSTAMPITQTLTIDTGNVWAKRIVSPKLLVQRGNNSLYMLQVSTDGQNWSDLKNYEKADNNVLDFGTLYVQSGTYYHFRTRYNNNNNLISSVVTVRTEDEQQVGNAGFENFWTDYLNVSISLTTSTYQREWYKPQLQYDSDPWWAVNSRMTMPNSHTTSNNNFKCFPCAGYSTDCVQGQKSALVYTTSVSTWNTAGTTLGDDIPGEIWIGTADDNGNHASDGHAFSSRPDYVKFHYRYSPFNSESYQFVLILKDAAGNEIARTEVTDGEAASEWTEAVLPIVYTDKNAKAANIYMSFKSCASGDISMNKTIELAGKSQSGHIGSELRIDNIQLIY